MVSMFCNPRTSGRVSMLLNPIGGMISLCEVLSWLSMPWSFVSVLAVELLVSPYDPVLARSDYLFVCSVEFRWFICRCPRRSHDSHLV